MSSAYYKLLEAVRELSTHERIAMIQTLLEDLKDGPSKSSFVEEQVQELSRRMEAFYKGEMLIISGEEPL